MASISALAAQEPWEWGCRLGQRQPPILCIAPWITANIAVVSLCKRHTNISRFCSVRIGGLGSWAIPRSKGKLPRASSRGQSPEVVILLFVHARPYPSRRGLFLPLDPLLRDSVLGATCVLAELSSILCAKCPPWQDFSSPAYRFRYIDGLKKVGGWRQKMETAALSDGKIRQYLPAGPRTAPTDSQAFSTDRSLRAADGRDRFRSAGASLPSWRPWLRWGTCSRGLRRGHVESHRCAASASRGESRIAPGSTRGSGR